MSSPKPYNERKYSVKHDKSINQFFAKNSKTEIPRTETKMKIHAQRTSGKIDDNNNHYDFTVAYTLYFVNGLRLTSMNFFI